MTDGGTHDRNDPWDFYNVLAPTLFSGGTMNNWDGAVTLFNDVLGVLEYTGTIDDQGPNGAGRDYNDDVNGEREADGIAYDRSVGAMWSGPPDGAVTLFIDVLLVLASPATSARRRGPTARNHTTQGRSQRPPLVFGWARP